jgi:hypothetical protein
MNRNASTMTDRQLIAEIAQLRGEMEHRAARIAELSRTLYVQTRRKGPRQEAERLKEEIYEVEGLTRRASDEMRPALQERLSALRIAHRTQEERLSTYTFVANTWTRFAGMVIQGIQRTRSSDRLLRQLPDAEEPEIEQDEPEAPPPAPVGEGETSPMEDLIEMYGEGDVNHAQGR